jgi:hypothetical protein
MWFTPFEWSAMHVSVRFIDLDLIVGIASGAQAAGLYFDQDEVHGDAPSNFFSHGSPRAIVLQRFREAFALFGDKNDLSTVGALVAAEEECI